MVRTNFERISGVLLDRCLPHGIWVDRGELQKIAEFLATGGEEEAARRAEEEERTSARRRALRPSPAMEPGSPFSATGALGFILERSFRQALMELGLV